MRRIFGYFDRATWLAAFLKWFRVNLPARRGLLVLGAVGVTVLSLIVQLVWLITDNKVLALCGFGLLHIALLMGFLGVLLAEALGRGYRE